MLVSRLNNLSVVMVFALVSKNALECEAFAVAPGSGGSIDTGAAGPALAFPGNKASVSRSNNPLHLSSGPNGKDAVTDEVDAVLQEMEDALRKVDEDGPFVRAKGVATKKMSPKLPSAILRSDIFLSCLSGGSIGVVLGIVISSLLSSETFFDDELYLAPPIVLASAFGGLSFVLASQETNIGSSTRAILGGLSKGLLNGIRGLIESLTNKAVAKVKALPGEVASGVKSKVTETVEGVQTEVKAIPNKIKKAADDKVQQVQDEVRSIPNKISKNIAETTDQIVTEIKATPEKITNNTKKAVDGTVSRLEKEVQEVTSKLLPKSEGARDEKAKTNLQ